jgi:hypothetical protein
VVQASEAFVRVIIRRPHAYFFLSELFKEQGGVASGTPQGCVLGDGTPVPIPGVYLLSPKGEVLANVALVGKDANQELLKALEAQ